MVAVDFAACATAVDGKETLRARTRPSDCFSVRGMGKRFS